MLIDFSTLHPPTPPSGTVCVRLMMFPLVILAQRNTANMQNHMPTMQRLQQKFSKARTSGNPLEGQYLMDLSLKKKQYLVIILQNGLRITLV